MVSSFQGQLEIDHGRGVIYFHLSDPLDVKELDAITILRISNLPPIVELISGNNNFLDINGSKANVNYNSHLNKNK